MSDSGKVQFPTIFLVNLYVTNIQSVRWVLVTIIQCWPIDRISYQQDEVQETESHLIGLNLHWKHAVNKAVWRKCSSGTDWTLFIYDLLIAGLTNLISVVELEVSINYNWMGLNYVLKGFNLQQNWAIFAWFKIEYSPSTFNHVCEQRSTGFHS